jgi:hypothetical protein
MGISLFMKHQAEPCVANNYHNEIAHLIVSSHLKLTGKSLISVDGLLHEHVSLGRLLYEAPFAILAHDRGEDPVFFYGNLKAQEVFEMKWSELIQLPSRNSAEFTNQAARQYLLDQVAAKGFIDNYTGTRISKTGRKFQIENATVWNLLNQDNEHIGQAATFK